MDFPKFISNVMIADDAIRTHKETKKGKVVAAPFGSAPPKYRMGITTAPPIHLDSCTSTSISVHSSSGLPAHLSASTSGERLRLYIHLHL
jgi:hypothetical protein